jgi:hypothetical protein
MARRLEYEPSVFCLLSFAAHCVSTARRTDHAAACVVRGSDRLCSGGLLAEVSAALRVLGGIAECVFNITVMPAMLCFAVLLRSASSRPLLVRLATLAPAARNRMLTAERFFIPLRFRDYSNYDSARIGVARIRSEMLRPRTRHHGGLGGLAGVPGALLAPRASQRRAAGRSAPHLKPAARVDMQRRKTRVTLPCRRS